MKIRKIKMIAKERLNKKKANKAYTTINRKKLQLKINYTNVEKNLKPYSNSEIKLRSINLIIDSLIPMLRLNNIDL